MATRGQYPEDWSPLPNKITTRLSRCEPRDERTQLPNSSERALQPKPLNVPSKRPGDSSILGTATQCRTRNSSPCEALSDPRVVDVGPSSTWQRNSPIQSDQKRKPSPSIASTRQSEISIGILEYYMSEPSPAFGSTPEFPPPTPKLPAAAEHFDFGLPPTPSPCTNVARKRPSMALKTRSRAATRAQADQPLIALSPPSQPRPSASLNRGYSLFPVIKEVVSAPRQPVKDHTTPILPKDSTPTSATNSIASPPENSYRPRKESLSSSVRTRNDSINSFQARLAKQRMHIPLRILPSSNTTSTPSHGSRRTASTSTATISPSSAGGAVHSRWSDDTTVSITSPSLASTPGPRTSFGSLLRRDSNVNYPACFFEDDDDDDDDESAHMLRKKWAWKKSTSSAGSSLERGSWAWRKGVREIYEVEEPDRGLWWKTWLCGCGGR